MAEKSRSIFEDVSSTAQKGTAQTPTKTPKENPKSPRIWLWILLGLVALMIVVGGLTRLTDSGLSITEWDLVMGSLPPLNAADWQDVFQKYQGTQEFQLQNSDMNLEQFKGIFWWEWAHRFLGRFIGLFWFLGFLWFWLRKELRRDRVRSVFFIGVLIGVQGAIGWWMVASGFEGTRVDVASYRLALHLGGAFWIIGLIYWNIKMLKYSQAELVEARRRGSQSLARNGKWIAGFIFAQILLGALVAGIDAGRSYTDWPLMGGEFFSSDSFLLQPWWRNFFESPALVQFMHRMNGYFVTILALAFMIRAWKAPYKQWRSLSRMLFGALILQIVIGVAVLMRSAALPEAITHQAVAIGIWLLVLGVVFAFRYPRAQKIQS